MSGRWPMVPLGRVLQLQRRWLKPEPARAYTEIGVRSFGKGIFQKNPVSGLSLGDKKVLRIEPGDLVFMNVFAWEGAVGVAGPSEAGTIGSHRFATFTPLGDSADVNFLRLFFTTTAGRDLLGRVSPGSAGRNRTMNLSAFAEQAVPLPPIGEQRRIVARVDALAAKIAEARGLHYAIEADAARLLRGQFHAAIENAPRVPMSRAAPLVRRAADIRPSSTYPELGIRSFGRGTFHKPAVAGVSVGTKKLYMIRTGDLLFSNVFAWEGAIAVAGASDDERYGSHRFMTCVADARLATPTFLRFFFTTDEGAAAIRAASPGGAGRNRTLGLEKLARIEVPLPAVSQQRKFDDLERSVGQALAVRAATAAELSALLPSVLAQAFRGEL